MLMSSRIRAELRILVPAVENSIGAEAHAVRGVYCYLLERYGTV
jgi:hypothetical protein